MINWYPSSHEIYEKEKLKYYKRQNEPLSQINHEVALKPNRAVSYIIEIRAGGEGFSILDRIKKEMNLPPPPPQTNNEFTIKLKRAFSSIIEMEEEACIDCASTSSQIWTEIVVTFANKGIKTIYPPFMKTVSEFSGSYSLRNSTPHAPLVWLHFPPFFFQRLLHSGYLKTRSHAHLRAADNCIKT